MPAELPIGVKFFDFSTMVTREVKGLHKVTNDDLEEIEKWYCPIISYYNSDEQDYDVDYNCYFSKAFIDSIIQVRKDLGRDLITGKKLEINDVKK